MEISFGAEIEFYSDIEILKLQSNIIQERGNNQFEIHSKIHTNPFEFIDDVEQAKNNLIKIASEKQIIIDFSPKPFKNDFGNAMQIQFSSFSQDFQESIEDICSQLCESTKDIFLIFAHEDDDYKRYNKEFMSPTHISFGPNNRSCLYRITGQNNQKRIEIRAASNNSDLELIICFIYISIIKALNKELENKFKMTYGNAYDRQYNLPEIPKSFNHAKTLFKTEFYEKYF